MDLIREVGFVHPASRNPPDIVKIMYSEGRISSDVFSLCFGHDGGYITLGEYDRSKHHPNASEQVFHFDGSQGQYKIELKSNNIEGVDLPISSSEINAQQGVFIDSGTTLIHGPTHIIEYDCV